MGNWKGACRLDGARRGMGQAVYGHYKKLVDYSYVRIYVMSPSFLLR